MAACIRPYTAPQSAAALIALHCTSISSSLDNLYAQSQSHCNLAMAARIRPHPAPRSAAASTNCMPSLSLTGTHHTPHLGQPQP
eukprot:1159183-Pelagomonas_calceolata.AAC.31